MKKRYTRELSRNQSILRFDVILQHDWPIEQCLLHIRVFFGGKTKSPCFDLFIHWLVKQITNTYRNHFSRSYENRSNFSAAKISNPRMPIWSPGRHIPMQECCFIWALWMIASKLYHFFKAKKLTGEPNNEFRWEKSSNTCF